MQIKVKTQVFESRSKVWAGFNKDLFMALAPAYPRLEVTRFDGCETGDEVHIVLHTGFVSLNWNARIVSHSFSNEANEFIDEGSVLPFPLVFWRHVHRIEDSPNGCIITDHVFYRTRIFLIDILLYPFLFLTVYQRKRAYRKFYSA
jgi:ligand-binding SRPBCC domain-containing protein